MEELQDGGRVGCGDHLPPHKYIRNTSTCGMTPTEHLLNAGRRPQTSQKKGRKEREREREKERKKERKERKKVSAIQFKIPRLLTSKQSNHKKEFFLPEIGSSNRNTSHKQFFKSSVIILCS